MQQELTNKIRSISIENNEISKTLNRLGVKDMQNISREQKQENGRQPSIRESFIHNYRTHRNGVAIYTKEKRNILKYH